MTSNKKLNQIAKLMFKNSLTSGVIDANKVKKITGEVIALKPSGLSKILNRYKRYIEEQLSKEEVTVEVAKPFKSQKMEKELLSKTGAKRIKYQLNPNIITGAKIKHGDWEYDASLSGKLGNLKAQI